MSDFEYQNVGLLRQIIHQKTYPSKLLNTTSQMIEVLVYRVSDYCAFTVK